MHYIVRGVAVILKRIAVLIGLIFILCGCDGSKLKIDIIKNDVSQDGAKIYTEVAEISGNSEFIKKVNAEIAEGIREETVKFQERAKESETPDDELKIEQTVAFSENGIVSLIVDCEEFTGGAHGELKRKVKNLDLDRECEISFSELFCDDKYPTRINAYIEQAMTEKPNKYADLWKRPLVSEGQEFYLTKTGVVVFYPPYELSYYSRGFVEFEIPYAELEGYLNPEYVKKIMNN